MKFKFGSVTFTAFLFGTLILPLLYIFVLDTSILQQFIRIVVLIQTLIRQRSFIMLIIYYYIQKIQIL